MKKMSLFVAVLALGLVSHSAITQTFTPPIADLHDLEHSKYYIWNMNLTGSVNPDNIASAKITLNSIYDWRGGNSTDKLFIDLLDKTYRTRSVYISSDPAITPVDKFDSGMFGPVTDIASLNVPGDIGIGVSKAKTIAIEFNDTQLAALKSYLADGKIALGFDPDCHYYNKGISFTIDTAVVPAPSAIYGCASVSHRHFSCPCLLRQQWCPR